MKNLILILALAFTISAKSYSQNSLVMVSTVTSGTITIVDTKQNVIQIHDAGLTAALTVTMPANPVNGQTVTLSSSGGITLLTLTTSSGTVANGLTSMSIGGTACWVYASQTNKWYKIK